MTTTAWFHCFSGVAGDMLLGALLDAGADLDEVRDIVETLGISGWSLDAEPVLRGGIAATRAVVDAPEGHHHRTWRTIRSTLTDARLPERVRARALAAFEALAVAEAALHRVHPDDVHFHEVGALDAIVDVVGVCAALEVLGIDEVRCSPVATGLGSTTAAHGHLPVPAPATLRLLEGVPVVGVDLDVELATPTGAALVRTLAGPGGFGALPPLVLSASGYGAGARELDRGPNVVQVVVGTRSTQDPPPGQPAVLLEANVDDATGEVLAHAVARLLDAGAHDAWVTPIVMKKGRPAHTVSALVDPALVADVGAVLSAETGTLGVRGTVLGRWPSARQVEVVDVEGHQVRVKITPEGRVKVEHDDAVAAAAALDRPLRQVLVDVEAAGRERMARQSER